MGGRCAAAAGRASSMADAASRPSSSPTTRCPGSSSASRASSGTETVVVDNASSDGTLAFVRERFPEVRLLEQANLGLGAGWNRGHRGDRRPLRAASSTPTRGWPRARSSGWSRSRTRRRDAAVVGPEAAQPGRQRCSARCAGSRPSGGSRPSTSSCASSRPRSQRAERVLRGRLRPRRGARGRVRDGRVHARPRARDRRGRRARRGVLPLQRGGRLVLPVRARRAGRRAVLPRRPSASTSAARRTAAGCSARTCAGISASSLKHHGAREAERAARCCGARCRLRGARRPRANGGGCTATPPAGSAPATCRSCSSDEPPSCSSGSRSRPGSCSAPGCDGGPRGRRAGRVGDARLGARRSCSARSASSSSSDASLASRSSCSLAAAVVAAPLAFRRRPCADPATRRRRGLGRSCSRAAALARRRGDRRRRALPSRPRAQARLDLGDLSLAPVDEFADGGLHPGYAFPLWHGFLALVAKVALRRPGRGRAARGRPCSPRSPCSSAYEAG